MGKRKSKKKKLLARRRRAGMDYIGSAADTDRISKLPDVILHHILSLLDSKDAFSAACLSKSWFNVWLTCPDLTFSFYPDVDLPSKTSSKFENFAKNTIPRFSMSELSLRSLRIKVHRSDFDQVWNPSSLPEKMIEFAVAKSIEFAVEKHVEILRVHGMGTLCRLPETICETIFTAKSLIELELRNLKFYFIDGNDTMFLWATRYDHFNNLKRLIFQDVFLAGYWEFEKLFCNIPLIEEIELCGCPLGFEKLRVSNVPKLKRFKMNDMYMYEGEFLLSIGGRRRTVEIVAPSLESFDYCGDSTVNIDACQNLKRLLLSYYTDLKSFNSFSNFLFLEFLEIKFRSGYMDPSFNISSESLKHVRIQAYEFDVEVRIDVEVVIDAPNLLLLEYEGNGCNSISFRNPPKQLKLTLSGHYVEEGEYPLPTWFHRVRSSLMKLGNRAKIYLSLHAHDMHKCFVSIKDSEELPEPEVEHLVLYCCDPDQHTEFDGEGTESFNNASGEAHRTLDEVMKAVEENKAVCFKVKWSA